jgi:hypothetical protein
VAPNQPRVPPEQWARVRPADVLAIQSFAAESFAADAG